MAIAVRDTGPGITQDRIPDLFEKFGVAADVSASKYGGAGLGLALSLQLCRLMGGDITVESARGVGSCFTITLPTMPSEAAQEPESKAKMCPSALPGRTLKSNSLAAADAISAASSRKPQTLVPSHAYDLAGHAWAFPGQFRCLVGKFLKQNTPTNELAALE